MQEQHADVLILGAGIAGYEVLKGLKKEFKKRNINKKITIVDKNNYFTFTPLLHEVATGGVLPNHASFSIREIISGTPHRFLKGTITHIDPVNKKVTIDGGTIVYDTCIVALGSVSNIYNTPGAEAHTFRIRTLEQAIALNQAFIEKLEEQNRKVLTINVVGGGYTGIEVAAEFAHLKKEEFKRMYPHIGVTINLIQAADVLVPNLPDGARTRIKDRLATLEIAIYTNVAATHITETELTLTDGTVLPNDITAWVTGFTTNASHLFDEQFVEKNRIPVNNNLHIPNFEHTYVIGDIAAIKDPDNHDILYPQLAEAAHKEGRYVVKHILAAQEKKLIHHFHFKSHGTLMPVGEWYGVGIIGPYIISGKFVWWLRRTVYVLFMPGFIRKLRIVADWTFIGKSARHLVHLNK